MNRPKSGPNTWPVHFVPLWPTMILPQQGVGELLVQAIIDFNLACFLFHYFPFDNLRPSRNESNVLHGLWIYKIRVESSFRGGRQISLKCPLNGQPMNISLC